MTEQPSPEEVDTPDPALRPLWKIPATRWVAVIVTTLLVFGGGALFQYMMTDATTQAPLRIDSYEPTFTPAQGEVDAVLSLQRSNGPQAYHQCTATLIRAAWAVTAAHCVTPVPDIKEQQKKEHKAAVCGSVDLGTRPADPVVSTSAPLVVRGATKNYGQGGQTATVVAVHTVPGWNWGLDDGPMRDLALLQLDPPMTIPPVPVATVPPSPHDLLLAAGWATWPDRCGGIIPEMQEWDLSPIPCRDWDREGHICGTTGGSVGPCEGVSGGPMFSDPKDGPRKLVGVYSHAPPVSYCGQKMVVYTLLPEFADFISSVMGS